MPASDTTHESRDCGTTRDLVNAAREFAIAAHGAQLYGTQPFVAHLDAVAAWLRPFSEEAVVIAYLHDVLEDTAVPLSQVRQQFGSRIARAVLLISDETEGPRAERKVLSNTKLAAAGPTDHMALLVKTADRLANVSACVRDADAERLTRYRAEHAAFRQAVYRSALCDALWERLERLLKHD